jgi:acetoin utilization deacetylase AcuC-like enzyme
MDRRAIHACACFNLHSSWIDMLLEFLPSEQKKQRAPVNLPDGSGQAPLMMAAAKLDHSERRYQTCVVLLDLGADKSIVDPFGHTALGKFREGQRAIRDMNGALFGMAPNSHTQHNTTQRTAPLSSL